MTCYIKKFDALPDDIKDMIYSKVVYSQSNELLQEIRDRKLYDFILKKIGYVDMKPTLENITQCLSNMPPIYSIAIMAKKQLDIIGKIRTKIIEID